MSFRVTLLLVAILAGCSSAPVITHTVPVVVERERPISIPADLLAPCPSKPDRLVNGVSVGMLREAALQYQNSYVPCLEGRLESIRRLQPGANP